MCGIAGFSFTVSDSDFQQLTAAALLIAIENRGRDATGIASFEGTNITIEKARLAATPFVLRERHSGANQTTILHTRFATQGSPRVNANNHPIRCGTIVGTHNGHVANELELARLFGGERNAQVDSESIFASLATGVDPRDVFESIRGGAAIAYLDEATQTLTVARIRRSPLFVTTVKSGFVYASTAAALTTAFRPKRIRELDEGEMLVVQNGQILSESRFTPRSELAPSRLVSTSRYGSSIVKGRK